MEVMWVQDLSSSFAGKVAGLAAEWGRSMATLQSEFPHSRFGLAGFSDMPLAPFGFPGSHDYCYQMRYRLTRYRERVQQSFENAIPRSGGDWPESQLTALLLAARSPTSNWRAELATPNGYVVHRFVLLVTDSIYHRAGDRAAAQAGADADSSTGLAFDLAALADADAKDAADGADGSTGTQLAVLLDAEVQAAALREAAMRDAAGIVAHAVEPPVPGAAPPAAGAAPPTATAAADAAAVAVEAAGPLLFGLPRLDAAGMASCLDVTDYPSVEDVRAALEEERILPVFFVTKAVAPVYRRLVRQLNGRGAVWTLDDDLTVPAARVEQALRAALGRVTNLPHDDDACTGAHPADCGCHGFDCCTDLAECDQHAAAVVLAFQAMPSRLSLQFDDRHFLHAHDEDDDDQALPDAQTSDAQTA